MRFTKILSRAYMWGIHHRQEPTNLMVISRDLSENLHYVTGLFERERQQYSLSTTSKRIRKTTYHCKFSMALDKPINWRKPYISTKAEV